MFCFQPKSTPPPPALKPKPKREEPYAHGHSTLPPRTHPIHTIDDDDEDRRKSADDMDAKRGGRAGVPLITKEELIRSYSPAGSREGKPEPKRPSQKVRESDQVATNIKRYSYEKEIEDQPHTEVRTDKVVIGPGSDSQVYHQRTPPEVKTQSYTISSVGGPVRKPVSEDVQVVETREVESAPPGGTTDSSRVVSHIPSVTTRRMLYDQPVAPAASSTGEVINCWLTPD